MAPLRDTALAGLAASLALAALGQAGLPGNWAGAHAVVALFAFLVPALEALNVHALGRLLRRPVKPQAQSTAAQLMAGATALLAAGAWLVPLAPVPAHALLGLGAFALLAGTGMMTGVVLAVAPRRGQSVVDVARDALTKGDDACAAQIRFAHFFLPLGAVGVALTGPWWEWGPAAGPWFLASAHVLLVGHGLLSLYALSHLWVPRLSGVPAIAPGAIKGELHTTLLGLTLLAAGFSLRLAPPLHGLSTGLLIVGGVSTFVGTFTFMGVLGANIMKNKSPTQRVTAEFGYVPWTFAGVFWLIAGVLLGIFLNAVPDLLASRAPALRLAHVHAIVAGGAAQLFLGYLLHVRPRDRLLPPASFRSGRWGLYGWNLGTALLLGGALADAPAWALAGSLALALALAAWFMTLLASLRARA